MPIAFRIASLLAAVACASSTVFAAAAKDANPTIPALKGIDLDGKLHRIGAAAGTRAIVFVFLSTECPVSNGYLPRLKKLAGEQRANTEFYGVISDSSVTRRAALAHRKKFNIDFTVLFDASGELRNALRPTHVPQGIVVNAKRKIIYSGLIDDWYASLGRKRVKTTRHYLTDAIASAVQGTVPDVGRTKPIGCLLEDPVAKPSSKGLTYCRDIAPVIFANCVTCHRKGEAAPFPLATYRDVARRGKQIIAVTKSRFMPPWKPVPNFGHFRNELRLTAREIALIAAWVKGGKSYGDAADLPPQPKFTSGWRLGKPDLIVKMARPYKLPAGGDDQFRHFVIPTGLDSTRLVAAVEFRPGNPRVAHHASIFFDNTGTGRKLDAISPGYGYHRFGGVGFVPSGSLGNWLPGSTPRRLPKGTGRLMPRGSDLVLQMHYQCTGKVEYDQSMIGIHFAKKSARQIVSEFQVFNCDLNVPAGAKRYKQHAEFRLPVDTTIFDAAPHMHLLGREMKVTAKLPGGKVLPIIWIKDWDFNWQGQYTFREPMRLPRGTRIMVDAWLDNSTGNPLNPCSPPEAANWGERTRDEMPLCQFRFTTGTSRDFLTLVRHYRKTLVTQFQAELRRAARRAAVSRGE